MKIPETKLPPDGELETVLTLILDGKYLTAALAFIKGVAPDFAAKLFESPSGETTPKDYTDTTEQ